ncbi:MAG: carboxypeptidase regulatory-like domain-containing protein, partial [Acidobacteria bacterium]|nr:carboxypeptidase regulatory-like domain-containing protein [Acidobacteriota bacterium]
TLTFSDTAAQTIPDSSAPTTGNYKPTNCETPVLAFAPPAPGLPYTEPGCSLIRPVEQTMFGQFGLVNGNGVWSLFIRDDAGTPLAPDTLMGEILGGWGLQLLPPTAAGVEVSGRVMTPDGRGLRNATVTMTDGQGVTRSAVTSSFGYYKFEGVTAGDNYVMNVNSRLYRFTPRVVLVSDTLTDVDFVGLE